MRGLKVLLVGVALAISCYAQERTDDALLQIEDFKIVDPAKQIESGVSLDEMTAAARAAVREGNRFLRTGDTATAGASYQRAIDLDPELYSAQFNLGVVFLRLKKYAEAEPLFAKAAALEPESGAAWQGLGFAHYYQKQYDLAVKAFSEAQRLLPDEPTVNNNLGFAYLFQRPQDGIQFFKNTLRLDPEFTPALTGLCTAYSLTKQTDQSISACLNAATSAGDSAVPYYFLGSAYLDSGKVKKAVNAFEQAMRLEPRTARIYVGLGFAYFKLKQHDKALGYFKQAYKLDPEVGHALSGMGATYAELGEYRKAEEVLRNALTLRDNPTVRYNLGMVCLARKDRDCALSQYNYLKIMGHSLAKPLFRAVFREKIVDASAYQNNQRR